MRVALHPQIVNTLFANIVRSAYIGGCARQLELDRPGYSVVDIQIWQKLAFMFTFAVFACHVQFRHVMALHLARPSACVFEKSSPGCSPELFESLASLVPNMLETFSLHGEVL